MSGENKEIKDNETQVTEVPVEKASLKNIMTQVSELVIKANSLIEEYSAKIKSLLERENAVSEAEKFHAIRDTDFSKREESVKHVEDVLALKKSVDKSIGEHNESASLLKKERSDFENYKTGEHSRLNELRLSTQKESNNLDAQRKNIKDAIDKGISDFVEKFLKDKKEKVDDGTPAA